MNFAKLTRFFLYLVPLVVAIVTPSTLFPFIVGKYFWFRLLISLATIVFSLELLLGKHKAHYWNKIKNLFRSPLVIALTIFVVVFLLASLLGIDPHLSFWSNFERGEGGLQMLYLFAWFVLLGTTLEKKHWRILLWMMLVGAVLMILYGVGAHLKFTDVDLETNTGGSWYATFRYFLGPAFTDPGFRFQGSIGNPAYVAAYLLFSLFFTGYLLATTKKPTTKIVLGALLLLFLSIFLLTATRGALIGLCAGVVGGLIFMAVKKKQWRMPVIIVGVVGLLLVASLFLLRTHPVIQNLPIARLFDISLSTQTFQHRAIMWGIAWEGFLERPILGWGPEGFSQVFYEHYNPTYFEPTEGYGAWFDRAHSFVFDYLVATGIVGLLAFVGLFITLFKLFASSPFRKKMSLEVQFLFLVLPIAYLVQALALFDVLVISIPLFCFMGFVNSNFTTKEIHE